MIKPTYSPQITFGNILQMLMLVAALFGAYYSVIQKVNNNTDEIEDVREVALKVEPAVDRMSLVLVRMQTHQDNVKDIIDKIEEKTSDRFTSKDALDFERRLAAVEAELALRRAWGDRLTALEVMNKHFSQSPKKE